MLRCSVYSKANLRLESERPPEPLAAGSVVAVANGHYSTINHDDGNREDPHYDSLVGETAMPDVTP